MGTTLPDREGKAEYRAPRLQLSLDDFQLERRLGEGSYAQVVQVMQKGNGQHFALKVVDKHLVLRNNYTEYIKTERKLLDRLDSPWIVNLHFTFQDAHSLYFVLELCSNGELHDQLQRRGKLPLDDATFYAAEVVLILEFLRGEKIVHRDLKPENILLDEQGHLKLIDFGSAKDFNAGAAPAQQPTQRLNSLQQSQRSTSMVGTAEYLAPEVLRNEETGFAADLWALGCLLYRMLLGSTPFAAASEYLIFERITAHDLLIPDTLAPPARDLLTQLLDSNPSRRIGARDRGLSELKEHPFFAGVAWQNLRKQKAPAAVHGQTREDDSVDWEWSSLAAALPVYTSPGESLASMNAIVQSTSHEQQDMGSQQRPGEHSPGLAAAAAAHPPKSALTGSLCKGTSSQMAGGGSQAKPSVQNKPGDRASPGCPRPQQHGPPGGTGMSAGGSGQGKSHSMSRSSSSAAGQAAPQHRTQAVRTDTAHERTGSSPAIACSPDKASGAPMSPKHDGQKSFAGAAHSAPHDHRMGSPKVPTRSPSRKGDFLSHNSGQATYGSSSSGRDDRTDQAASIMMLNQLIADAAHTYAPS